MRLQHRGAVAPTSTLVSAERGARGCLAGCRDRGPPDESILTSRERGDEGSPRRCLCGVAARAARRFGPGGESSAARSASRFTGGRRRIRRRVPSAEHVPGRPTPRRRHPSRPSPATHAATALHVGSAGASWNHGHVARRAPSHGGARSESYFSEARGASQDGRARTPVAPAPLAVVSRAAPLVAGLARGTGPHPRLRRLRRKHDRDDVVALRVHLVDDARVTSRRNAASSATRASAPARRAWGCPLAGCRSRPIDGDRD